MVHLKNLSDLPQRAGHKNQECVALSGINTVEIDKEFSSLDLSTSCFKSGLILTIKRHKDYIYLMNCNS